MPPSGSREDERIIVVYGRELSEYAFSEDHPLQPGRYVLTMSLLESLGWLKAPGVEIEAPEPATLSELLTVHSYPYVQAVQQAQQIAQGRSEPVDLTFYGLGTGDNPLFEAIHDASALCVGATIHAMTAILEGRALHAYNPAGGLHHAMKARASGFCVYNDCAVAITKALDEGRRVAYVDIDAHHGDGVQAAFYSDPRVLTISIHESGRFLFPGTGEIHEIGTGEGRGTSINVPLSAMGGDEEIIRALETVVEPALRAFSPDILVTQTGADSHHSDPLTDLTATLAVFPTVAEHLHAIVHEICEGRWLIVGGGGYDPADFTPRAWTAFLGAVLGQDVNAAVLPEEWREACRRAGGQPPLRLLDDPGPAYRALPDPHMPRMMEKIATSALEELRRVHAAR